VNLVEGFEGRLMKLEDEVLGGGELVVCDGMGLRVW
jgi:hypothetical protein